MDANKKSSVPMSTLIYIIGVIFAAGIAYSELKSLHRQVDVLEQRLDKKIKTINDLDEELHDLEVKVAEIHCK